MKFVILMALSMFSFSAMAFLNEVECEATKNGKTVYLEIEQPFPQGSSFRNANMEVMSDEGDKTFRYNVTYRRFSGGFNSITYTGAGLRLEVDLWPDSAPRWGRTYRGTISSSDLEERYIQAECRYPHI